MLEPELRQPVEVWLAMDNDGVGVRVYSQDNRLADAYRAGAPSLDAAQGEITAHYTKRGYTADGEWRPQRWSTGPTGYGEIVRESSGMFH